MRGNRFTIAVVTFVFALLRFGMCEEPESVTVCQLKNDPAAYNHKLVEVTAFVSHDFEDFTLFDPECASWPRVWLEYGGKAKSGTMYCCGVTADRHRPKELTVENIAIPLNDDRRFREFDRLIQPPFRSDRYGSIVHATVVGRFFSGKQIRVLKTTHWGGYGHMGCCSLLAIQKIQSVNPQDRYDLDYGASADQPDIEKTGCGYRDLTPIDPTNDLIKAQREADLGLKNGAFDDPRHVATDVLKRFAHIEQQSISGLRQTRKAQGRAVYVWSPKGNAETYMVVVSRPYWLSFYAHDPTHVAWMVAAAYLSSCGGNSSVTRIK